MKNLLGKLLLAGLAVWMFSGGTLQAQDRRRALKTPGLVVETGFPVGRIYSLQFTRDERQLLIAGGDKVARLWDYADGKLDRTNAMTLRWPAWREQRGTIYAADFSIDPEQRFVALAGHGLITGSITILDRKTAKVVHSLTQPEDDGVITALRFASENEIIYGTINGDIRLWRFAGDNERAQQLGRHSQGGDARIRLIAQTGKSRFASVSKNGSVFRWSLQSKQGVKSFQFDLDVAAAVYDQKRDQFIVGGISPASGRAVVEVSDHDGKLRKRIRLKEGNYPRVLAMHPQRRLVAIGLASMPNAREGYKPPSSRIVFYDLDKSKADYAKFRPTNLIGAMSFAPGGKHLVIGGGDNNELTVIDTAGGSLTDLQRGPGRAIWQVAFSKDGKSFAFRDQRNDNPSGVHDRASGNWRRFDLRRRDWIKGNETFTPHRPLRELGGWAVKPDSNDPYVWYAVSPQGKSLKLPLDREIDMRPRCYTFFRSESGNVRLAVGHRWGISLFALNESGVRRQRLFVGHSDDVTYIAPSPNQRILISCSRDQTISAWSLADWAHQPELGAAFEVNRGKLLVSKVADGSPAWEAGLIPGDELTLFAFDGKELQGGPAVWLRRLRSPVPGREFFFRVKRKGKAELVDMLTTVRQRPIWRFFPTRDDDWVLWRWRDYFYDSSTDGDSFIGWQTVGGPDETPTFEEAEKLRRIFHRPDKVSDVLAKTRHSPERVAYPDLVPPEVGIAIRKLDGGGFQATIKVAPRDRHAIASEPREVSLWINDFKFKSWTQPGSELTSKVLIPTSKLRSGSNVIVAQAYNRAGARGDSDRRTIRMPSSKQASRVYGLLVGISDYSKAARGKRGSVVWGDLLFAAADAEAMSTIWKRQGKTDIYRSAEIVRLLDDAASRDAIRRQLQKLQQIVQPDDVLVLFLAGHGYAKKKREHVYVPGSFVFACPEFDSNDASRTGVSALDLYQLVSKLPCRKLLLFDCCHSGSTNILREFSPEGIGPLMMAACQPSELSYDIPFLGHGAFSNAVIEALDAQSDKVDRNRDNAVSSKELFEYVSMRVPETIELAKPVLGDRAVQTPQGLLGTPQDAAPVAATAEKSKNKQSR